MHVSPGKFGDVVDNGEGRAIDRRNRVSTVFCN